MPILALECAVVARKHYMLGDVPVAFIRLNEEAKSFSEDEISRRVIAYCQEALADFKVPRSVHIVDDLPRSTLDRIDKAKLRKSLTIIEPE